MQLQILPVHGIPEVKAGEDVGGLIVRAALAQGAGLCDGDVVVVTQKIVSKAEGRVVDPSSVEPSAFARNLAACVGKQPKDVEVILRESSRLVRTAPGTLIMETRHGFVCANAGVDQSNVEGQCMCLLPEDSDRSARAIRDRIGQEAGVRVAVIISDTFGRAWRMGQTNIAIGVAGMRPFADYRGQADTFGYELRVTQIAVIDELAGAAELVMGKTEQVPVALIRGYPYEPFDGAISELIRPAEKDLFR